MITFIFDEMVPCLKDAETGEIYETEVIRLVRKSFLAKYNSKTGWYVNWSKFDKDTEIYALVLKGTVDIQGLVAIRYDADAQCVYLVWGCTAPQNNVWKYGKQKYIGVGGHLFAIAAELFVKHGYDGFVYGDAMDREIYQYYVDQFHAVPLPSSEHQYRFMLSDDATQKIREVYDYAWSDECI